MRDARTGALLALALAVGALVAPRLLEARAIESILLALPILLVVAIGEAAVIISGGIDVSVGSTLGLAAMLTGMAFRAHPGLPPALGAALAAAIGLGLGCVNGGLVAFGRVPPIIATLGTLSAFRGLAFIVSGGSQVDSNDIPQRLIDWSVGGPVAIGGVTAPWVLVLAVAVAACGYATFRFTGVGRDLYALGGNAAAATLRGVRTKRALLFAYAFCGLLAGFGGALYASRFGSVNPGTAGRGLELTVIAAAVVGGCDVRGGAGSAVGVALGCALLALVQVALAVLGVSADWQLLAYGGVILLALGLEALGRGAALGAPARDPS